MTAISVIACRHRRRACRSAGPPQKTQTLGEIGGHATGYSRHVSTTKYVALLRGINVGGRNKVRMSDLNDVFERAGYDAVSTYIQSGNVLFQSDRPGSADENAIEELLLGRFGIPITVVVRSRSQFRKIVNDAPSGFGEQHDVYHSDVIFLKAPLTSRKAIATVALREDVDQVWPGSGVLYFSRLSERRTQSRMGQLVGKPEYKSMTIRSWKTVTKLHDLLD